MTNYFLSRFMILNASSAKPRLSLDPKCGREPRASSQEDEQRVGKAGVARPFLLAACEGAGPNTAALVRVSCSNETCGLAPFMHKDYFNAFEVAALQSLKTSGKGYDLAYKACSCKCGHGHVKKEDASQ